MSRTQPPDEAADLVAWLRGRLDWTAIDADPAALDVDFPNYEGGVDTPGIRVSTPETDTLRGGATGYSGMSPGGEGPTQDLRTTLQVDAWGGTENDGDVLESHPDVVATQLRSEVWRVVLEDPAPEGYQYLSVLDTSTGHDTDADPVEYRQILFVALGYSLRPPANS